MKASVTNQGPVRKPGAQSLPVNPMSAKHIEKRLEAASKSSGIPKRELRGLLMRTALDAFEGPGIKVGPEIKTALP